MNAFSAWLRGILLLRHPALVKDLGRRLRQLEALARLRQANPGAKIEPGVHLLGSLQGPDIARISLAQGSMVCDGTVLSCGDATIGVGRIAIGAGTWIGQYNNLRAGGGDIRIGKGCLVSQFCTIVATNHAHARGAPIQSQGIDQSRTGVALGDDVWLGAGCAVLPGVTIGDGAVIGSNSVVTKDVPPGEVWGGVPAHKIGERA